MAEASNPDVWCCGAVVKLQSLAIKSAGAEGRAPRRVKLFINRASLGFSEAADFAPVQVRRRGRLPTFTSPAPCTVATARGRALMCHI